jgi:hypothetical protein
MILETIVTTIGGGIMAFLRDGYHFKLEQIKEDKNLEREIKRKEHDLLIEKEATKQAEFGVDIEKEKTYGIQAQSEANIAVAEQETEQDYYKNIAKSSQPINNVHNSKLIHIANFIIATTRSFITYLIVITFCISIGIVLFQEKDLSKEEMELFQCLFLILDYTLSYWFFKYIKRGSETLQKKK